MENTEPLKGLGESQDAKNDQEMFHRHRIQATLRRDDTEITGSERFSRALRPLLKLLMLFIGLGHP